eukprot:TRINITY_DN550_c0_g1_i2.p1 TRINITY_DN550_c0_g1~~TRINITY_DN550_c0_g1_i2.p1  ORF type:complete len:229 (+),score=37.86 TRINITY_DN550_c0_g1_i2:43-687(+)
MDPAPELKIKVVVVGHAGAGKTSIVRRYTGHKYSPNYLPTIGVDFATKKVNVVVQNKPITASLQLWDIAGQERFGSMTNIYYRSARGAIIVFDISNAKTFNAVENWDVDIKTKVDTGPIPILLLGNKVDLLSGTVPACVSSDQLNKICEKNEFIGWYHTSAKRDTNIDKAMNFLLDKILEKSDFSQLIPEKPDDRIRVSQVNGKLQDDHSDSCC